MYYPDKGDIAKSTLDTKEPDIVLQTKAMKSNPLVGIASLSVNSNLDPRIKPTSVVDLSKLITISTGESEDTLELVDGYLKSFSSYSKYQVFAVSHSGSNYTAEWNTNLTALSPTKGTVMSTVNWMTIT